LSALTGNANVYSILPAKKLHQSIDVFDLTWCGPMNRAASSKVASSTPGHSLGSMTRVSLRLKSCFCGSGTTRF